MEGGCHSYTLDRQRVDCHQLSEQGGGCTAYSSNEGMVGSLALGSDLGRLDTLFRLLGVFVLHLTDYHRSPWLESFCGPI